MGKSAVLTPLEVAALALLAERPMHPYEMYQLLMERREDRIVKVRPGTLYHAVGRLAEAGLVTATGTQREGNRPERTTYSIAEQGHHALQSRIKDLLAVPANEYPSFPLAVSEAHHLPAPDVTALLEQRLSGLETQLGLLEASSSAVEAKALPAKYWLDIRYQQAMLSAEIGWIRKLHDDISSGVLAW